MLKCNYRIVLIFSVGRPITALPLFITIGRSINFGLFTMAVIISESLKSLLKVQPDPRFEFITGRVITDHDYAFFKSLMVNVGAEDGLEKSQPVISGEGVVGRVVEVGQQASRVLLITDMNSKIPAYLERSGYHAILAGQNTERLAVEHLPVDAVLKEGEYVLTSGKGGAFPLGLPIGEVRLDDNQVPYVHPFAAFERMIHVRVLNTTQDPNLRSAQSN